MSFSDTDVLQKYVGDGVSTTFAIPFYMLASNPTWIKVYTINNTTFAETVWTLNTHYTLTPNEVNPTNVVFGPSFIPAAGETILIRRELPLTQETSFVNTAQFQKEDYEKALDKVIMQMQQLDEKVNRAVLHSYGSGYTGKSLPVPTDSNILTWDGAGNIVNLPLTSIASGTYTGEALKFPSISHTTGTLTVPASAAYSVIFAVGGLSKNIDLPLCTAVGAGRVFIVIADTSGGSATTIRRTGADTIEGNTSLIPAANSFNYMFTSDGVGVWRSTRLHQQEVITSMIADNAVSSQKSNLTIGTTRTANYTATQADGNIPCDTTAGGFTLTLPAAASSSGRVYEITNTGTANSLTIDANAAETIEGLLTKTLRAGERMTIFCNGTTWRVVSIRCQEHVSVESSTFTANGAAIRFNLMVGNSIALTPGRWMLYGNAFWTSSGGTAAYTEFGTGWAGANGDNTATIPTLLTAAANVTVEGSFRTSTGFQQYRPTAAIDSNYMPFSTTIIKVTGAATIFANTLQTCTTAANVRVLVQMNAVKIGD